MQLNKRFKLYARKGMVSMRPFVWGEDLSGVHVPAGVIPSPGGMIAADERGCLSYVPREDFQRDFYQAPMEVLPEPDKRPLRHVLKETDALLETA